MILVLFLVQKGIKDHRYWNQWLHHYLNMDQPHVRVDDAAGEPDGDAVGDAGLVRVEQDGAEGRAAHLRGIRIRMFVYKVD